MMQMTIEHECGVCWNLAIIYFVYHYHILGSHRLCLSFCETLAGATCYEYRIFFGHMYHCILEFFRLIPLPVRYFRLILLQYQITIIIVLRLGTPIAPFRLSRQLSAVSSLQTLLRRPMRPLRPNPLQLPVVSTKVPSYIPVEGNPFNEGLPQKPLTDGIKNKVEVWTAAAARAFLSVISL